MSASPRAGQIGTVVWLPSFVSSGFACAVGPALRVRWGGGVRLSSQQDDQSITKHRHSYGVELCSSHFLTGAAEPATRSAARGSKLQSRPSNAAKIQWWGEGFHKPAYSKPAPPPILPPTHFTWPQLHSLAWGTGYTLSLGKSRRCRCSRRINSAKNEKTPSCTLSPSPRSAIERVKAGW